MLMQTLVRPMGPLRLASFSLLICAAAASPSSNSMDVGAGAFSPDGSLFQLQYATRAAERGGLAVGVEAQGAVVLTVERDTSKRAATTKVGWLFRLETLFVGSLVVFGMLAAIGGLLWP